jgi:hypothetical protein
MADQAVIDKLANQILSQGLTSQWKGTGHGSAEANARDMAKIMADTGITDIRQFGKVPVYEDVVEIGKSFSGQIVRTGIDEYTGQTFSYISKPSGQYDQDGGEISTIVEVPKDAKLETVYGQFVGGDDSYAAVDPSKLKTINGKLVVDTGQTSFGNKATGKAVANTYSERQTGNAFGGTFAGKGNTGYRVQFTPDGTPIFYTTYATSNDLAILMQDLGPIGQIGLALATGGLSIPQQIAAQVAIQVLSGADLETVIKNAAVSFATAQIPGTDVMKDANKFITDLGLPAALTTTLNNAVQTAAVSGGKALLTGQSLTDAIVSGFTSGGLNGAVNALLPNIDGFKDLNNTQKRLVTNAVTGFVSGKPLDQILINTAIAAATQQVSDQRRLNAPLDEQAISELTPEEKAVYDESGTQGLKAYLDSLKTKPTGDDGTSGTGTDTTGLDEGPIIPVGTGGTETVTVTGANGCSANEYWDPVLKRCELKKIDTSTGTGTGIETVTVTSCPAGQVRNSAGICEAINCGEGKYWDPITKQCEVKKIDTIDTGTGTGVDTVTVTSCGEGKVRNAAGICENINCGDGKYWDPITKQCEVKKIDDVVTTLTCGANEEKSPDGLSCLPKCGPGYKRGPDGITCVKDDEIVITSCGEGKVRNAKGDCVDIDCGDGKYWDPITKKCEIRKVDDIVTTLTCGANEEKSPDGKSCIPKCGTGFKRGPDGISCVPITTTVTPVTCPPGQTKNAAGICVPTTTTTTPTTPSFVPTAIPASTETTSPIYAGPMGAFDLFATLPELLADDTDKEDKKKTTRQTQQTTKMATGGLLDDLLAEQMTVDDLLNLLR